MVHEKIDSTSTLHIIPSVPTCKDKGGIRGCCAEWIAYGVMLFPLLNLYGFQLKFNYSILKADSILDASFSPSHLVSVPSLSLYGRSMKKFAVSVSHVSEVVCSSGLCDIFRWKTLDFHFSKGGFCDSSMWRSQILLSCGELKNVKELHSVPTEFPLDLGVKLC
uniref:Uncharacterized protein n=1 Tax=Solanum lycopersicum TaxID=4081 RepID=A0A3Q7GME9_SOLLC